MADLRRRWIDLDERELERRIKETWSLPELTVILDMLPTAESEDGHVLCDLALEQGLRILARVVGLTDEAEQLIEASDKIGKWYA